MLFNFCIWVVAFLDSDDGSIFIPCFVASQLFSSMEKIWFGLIYLCKVAIKLLQNHNERNPLLWCDRLWFSWNEWDFQEILPWNENLFSYRLFSEDWRAYQQNFSCGQHQRNKITSQIQNARDWSQSSVAFILSRIVIKDNVQFSSILIVLNNVCISQRFEH